MELQTISQVSRTYGVSVRMLRYYEETGLIESKRRDGYAYRVYDDQAIRRLQQIVILRKLQIPVKQIGAILQNQDASQTVEIFRDAMEELGEEINALSTIRSILYLLAEALEAQANVRVGMDLLSDASVLPLIESLSFAKHKIKERLSMEELNKADAALAKLEEKKERAMTAHPQETLIETFDYKGVAVDLVEWTETIWCGKIGYAVNNTDEPNVDEILSGFFALNLPSIVPNGRAEDEWDVCMSVNYLSPERPNGVMFGFQVTTAQQPEGFDLYRVLAGQYMRIRLTAEAAIALGHQPWHGGIPPYEWIGEQIAPTLGFKYGADTMPIYEYYGYYDPGKNIHEFGYLYVPVERA